MARKSHTTFRALMLAGCASLTLGGAALAQSAKPMHFDIPAEDLGSALNQLAQQGQREIVFNADLARGKHAAALKGDYTAQQALEHLLAGTGLRARLTASGSIVVEDVGPQQSGAAETAQEVSEVVVTAQKRSERLLTVAAPVTALGATDLVRSQAVRFEDYAAKVPGLNLASDRDGQTQLIIRGITTGSYVSSTVATYIDDTPFGNSTSAALGGELTPDLDPSDLQRIEVLRGPQGTLYGASALGGLVKFVTVEPGLDRYAGRIEVDGSSVDHGGDGYGVRGMVNIPLVEDQLALRVSAYDRRDPGYISDPNLNSRDVNKTDLHGGHASLLWRPSQSFSLNISALAENLSSAGSNDEDVNVIAGKLVPAYGDLQQFRYTTEPVHINYQLYSGTAKYDFGWAELTSITSYSTLHQNQIVDETTTFGPLGTAITGVPNFGTSTGSIISENKFTEEVRLASPAGRTIEWQGGVFYTRETSGRAEPTFNFDSVTGLPNGAPSLFYAFLDSTYREVAGFGDLTYHFSPKFDVQGGLRVAHNSQFFSLYESGIFAGTNAPPGTSSDTSVTFLVAPRYKLDENNMIYARVSSGYRPGGPNAPTAADHAHGVPDSYQPDTLTNYEVGYKSSIFDHRLTLDLSAFYIDWKDIQIETIFNGISSNGNGGSAVSEGFEANAALTPISGLTLNAELAYTDAHLTEDAPGVNGFKGDELPNVPKWSANLSTDYEFPLTGAVSAFVGGNIRYMGERASGFISGPRPVLPEYTTVDLRTGFDYKNMTVEFYAKNVADKRGFNNITSLDLSGAANPWAASVIQPRTLGVSVAARF